MTPAEFDTRRRLLGLSIQEAADWCGVTRRTVERWISGYSDVAAGATAALERLECAMQLAVDAAVDLAAEGAPDAVQLLRYRSQAAVDSSPHAAGLPLGAHAVLIGWTAEALEAEGYAVKIAWGDA